MQQFGNKTSDEIVVLSIDMSALLPPGVVIQSAVVSIETVRGIDPNPDQMLSGAPSLDSAKKIVSQLVQGGAPSTTYVLSYLATLSDGQIMEDQGSLYVTEYL